MKTLAHSRKTGEGTVCALLELGGREGDPFSSASTAVRHDQMRQLTRATPSGSTGADSPSTADFVQPLPPFDRNPLFTVLIHRYSPCAL